MQGKPRRAAPEAGDERLSELSRQLKEAEERAGAFQRDARASADLIGQLEETSRVEQQARRKLEALVERQSEELERWRGEAAREKLRARDLEARLSQSADAEKGLRAELEAEHQRLEAEFKRAMESAEAVRREGIEALEQSRSLKGKTKS